MDDLKTILKCLVLFIILISYTQHIFVASTTDGEINNPNNTSSSSSDVITNRERSSKTTSKVKGKLEIFYLYCG